MRKHGAQIGIWSGADPIAVLARIAASRPTGRAEQSAVLTLLAGASACRPRSFVPRPSGLASRNLAPRA